MEDVTVSRMQAVELAKGIVEARDSELAFALQIQEIVKSESSHLQGHDVDAGTEEDMEPSMEKVLEGSQVSGDVDKAAALNLFVDELGSFVEDSDETQLSLLEAARLAHLDAIKEHDARFARLLESMSDRDVDFAEHPFSSSVPAPADALGNEVDEYESVLSLIEGASILTGFKRPRCRGAGMGKHQAAGGRIPVLMQRATLSVTAPLTIRDTAPRICTVDKNQQGKGKMVVQEVDDDGVFALDNPLDFHILNTKRGAPSTPGSSREDDTDTNADENGMQYCQICLEATQTTSTFVTLEGCEHQFCKSCVSRHAEARIVDGGQMHVTCLHTECPTIISDKQLSLLVRSPLLEVLKRRRLEAAIPETERSYCPFRDCSALLIRPSTDKPSSSTHPPPTAFDCVECEVCHRAFCLECAVPWHTDMNCAEYKANMENLLLKGDEKLLQLAGEQKWQRCKKCGRVVELSHGCFHMTCLCKNEFCYVCGKSWVGGLKTCPCARWNESRL